MAQTKKQPTPKKGFEFTGWATFNWGMCHGQVFRTRRDAIAWCMECPSDRTETWKKDVSKYMKVVKVKCIVV